MIGAGTAKTLVGGAVGVLAAVGGVARHVAWYVRYRAAGTARDGDQHAESPPPEGPG